MQGEQQGFGCFKDKAHRHHALAAD